jgi:hypothetical protein
VKVRRLGGDTHSWRAAVINYNLISFSALLRHLRKLPGLTVEWKKSWLPTDDHWANLRYKNYRLWIDSEFVDFTVCPGEDCPEDVFLEVVTHLEIYRPWWPNRLAAAAFEQYRKWQAEAHAKGRYSVVTPRPEAGDSRKGKDRRP